MTKEIYKKLEAKAYEVAERYSNPDRARNFNNEVFSVINIIPTSELSANVVFQKDTGKRALSVFMYIEMSGGFWLYFFPKDSHILGLQEVAKIKLEIEQYNAGYN